MSDEQGLWQAIHTLHPLIGESKHPCSDLEKTLEQVAAALSDLEQTAQALAQGDLSYPAQDGGRLGHALSAIRQRLQELEDKNRAVEAEQQRADQALYQAKNLGRNHSAVYKEKESTR